MPKLTELKDGQKAKITGISGDRRYLSRVTSIGLNVGCDIEMLQNVNNRPVLVYGRDTMIALNRIGENNCGGVKIMSAEKKIAL